MEAITSAVNWLNGVVWGVPMLVLILGVGSVPDTVGLRLLTILMRIPFGFGLLRAKGRIPSGEGEISTIQCPDDVALGDNRHG